MQMTNTLQFHNGMNPKQLEYSRLLPFPWTIMAISIERVSDFRIGSEPTDNLVIFGYVARYLIIITVPQNV